MAVIAKGADKVFRKIVSAPEKIKKKTAYTLQEYGNMMVVHARRNHKFTTRTGQLERAITAKVDKNNLALLFYINPDFVTNNGYNYGVIQHDGSGRDGYKESIFSSPSFSSKGGKGGVESDHFMVRANDEYQEALTEALRKVVFDSLRLG